MTLYAVLTTWQQGQLPPPPPPPLPLETKKKEGRRDAFLCDKSKELARSSRNFSHTFLDASARALHISAAKSPLQNFKCLNCLMALFQCLLQNSTWFLPSQSFCNFQYAERNYYGQLGWWSRQMAVEAHSPHWLRCQVGTCANTQSDILLLQLLSVLPYLMSGLEEVP